MDHLSAGSIGIGAGGIACCGDLAAGIGGNGIMYANSGFEATTINVAGVGTISSLTVNADVTCARATRTSIVANKNFTLGQDGDTFGSTCLHLRNRSGENGAIFETTHPTVTLVDFVFKHAGGQRVLRLEGRANSSPLHSADTWKLGGAALSSPTLQVGDNAAGFHQPLRLTEATCPGPMTVCGTLNLASSGLASHVKFNGSDCIRLNQPTRRYRAPPPLQAR